ncbi:hypothetical protein VTN77DRAFT_8135 [Rasamsonia byssochlamydoides]|uniref:uncharacterized protein n=1 Tax=Rasamsonia byssochlamydoides TaxID=89139 RepID=UPI0037430487
MEDHHVLGEDLPLPPARLFERLALLPGYTWDQTIEPFHSTYDNWHVFGIRQSFDSDVSTPAATSSGPSSATRESPRIESRPPFRHHWRSSLSESSSDLSSRLDHEPSWVPVVARVSTHVVRLEREFHTMRSIVQISDPDCVHTVRPIDLIRLSPEPDDPGPILVSIFESPGPNYLKELVAFGPAWFGFGPKGDNSTGSTPGEQVSLPLFLDFAIGACDCLELLHYGLKTIHGEIRGDAFHFNRATGAVKLINTGNGARAFDNALGEGWAALSRELGVKTKLQFIAPEQTGRMPTEPDSRTDIYALGVLFWIMLVGKPAFTGNSPVEVVQNVLGKKLPPVSAKRIDIPDAVSKVIQKMTQKEVSERYHTITSVKRDLEQIAKLLGDGDIQALKEFEVAKRDVSSFFTLPSQMYGRKEEYEKIISVVEKVHRRQQVAYAKAAAQASSNPFYLGSASSMSEGRVDSFEIGEGSSDSGSFNFTNSRSNSNVGPYLPGHVSTHESTHSTESSISTQRAGGPPPTSFPTKTKNDSRGDTADRESHLSTSASTQSPMEPLNSLTRHKTPKLRRSGRCEVITVSGAAGIGKSDLIQRVQPAIRKLGYVGVARLDRARRIPFEAFAKILANLLRQIFSERDVTSDYHNSVRAFLRPLWPTLHEILELPEQLISSGYTDKSLSPKLSVAQHLLREGPKAETAKRPNLGHGQSPVEVFVSGTSNKNMRLMETYLEILRNLCTHKLICVCLDDLQYVDDETSDLIINILKAKIPCLLILTARKAEIESAEIRSLFEAETPSITKIELQPLTDEEITNYVAATMHQPPGPSLTPLTAVIQEKSRGNPFYVRMMLETCYRKNCIWYSWRHSTWEFDLDRIFTEFVSPAYGEGLGTDFIAKRLQEVPSEARSILIWASFLGSPFSFSLIQRLLTGEFWFSTEDDGGGENFCVMPTEPLRSEADIVAGLQSLVQSYIILPGETDDEFRFAHDRYVHAVSSMRECHNVEKMHFIIAQTMMKYCPDDKVLYSKARHISQASRLIKARVKDRSSYRKVLRDAAQMAVRSGARPTALWYFRNCLDLLQTDCWNDNLPDVDYEETRQLHISTAEMLWYQGQSEEAFNLLSELFQHAKTAAGKARAWILKSKIHAQAGDHNRAMDSLLTSLEELGVHFRQPTSYEQCDEEFDQLRHHLKSINFESEIQKPISEDENVVSIGNVLAEAMAVAFWGDDLTFLHMTIEMIKLHLFSGRFTQIGLGCTHLAMVAYSRYKDPELGARMSDLSFLLYDRYADLWTRGAGLTIQTSMVEHLRVPLRMSLPTLENAVEASFASGDPHIMLLSFASMATARLYLGQDMSELETFCTETPEELDDWVHDTRGGVVLVAVKQVARALQGKTSWQVPAYVMSDEYHKTHEFMEHIDLHATRADRPRDIYWGLAMIPLYVYGHYEKAIEVGSQMMESVDRLWSMRISYLIYFYLSLSILTQHFDNPGRSNLDSRLEDVLKYKAEIDFARSACDANYGMWSLLLEALLCEVRGDLSSAVLAYEAAIDHCEIHGLPLEEALALELHGDFLVRRGAKRPARAMIKEAIAAWTGLSATGKAAQLSEKHEWLLKTATTPRCVDVGCQTVDSLASITRNSAPPEPAVVPPPMEDDRKKHWLEHHEPSAGEGSLDISSVGLDIIDLSSILEFSQVMSSELQIDKLLTKMIEIILESCNGSDFAVIATEFEDLGYAIAAAGDLENGQTAFLDGLPFSEMEDKIAQQISHYTLRTREEVLVHNVLEDDRFSIVSDAYQARYPLGRSVITLPIVQADNLLGVIHIEGKPNSFTQRNVVVLRLLCNQAGISLSNAFLFRKARKVSATNAAMVETQKRALAQAREAEQKAKVAEAEANRNVKLKDDAAKAKSIFLANVSHDLRTPMNGVIGLSELLKGTKLDKEQDGYVESIRVCADTLLTLINDILDFSKLEAGKMKITTVPLNLKETISEVVRALRYTHRDRGLETIEDLDKVPSDLVVMGDPVRLHQIFMNLLSNSYKFTPKGSVTVRAKVSREGKGRVRLECSVEDTGIGIPEEHKSRLFRPFSQADSSTARSYGGSGLGLSICKAIIEDVLGGLIWLDSTPGVGTTVTFQLVFNKAPKEAIVKAPWSHNFNQVEVRGPPKPVARDLTTIPRDQIRVCIAEDNPINQKIAVQFVRGLGLQSEAFSDGQQAVEALRQRSKEGRPFHVVLMDVQMPVLDGYNATREIRRDEDPNVNEALVIAMTASAIEGDREKCLDAGMNNYLAKPVRSGVLSEMLDQYLAPAPQPKLRRRPLPPSSSDAMSDGVGTPSSYTSSSTTSHVSALDEPLPPQLEPSPQLPDRSDARSPVSANGEVDATPTEDRPALDKTDTPSSS